MQNQTKAASVCRSFRNLASECSSKTLSQGAELKARGETTLQLLNALSHSLPITLQDITMTNGIFWFGFGFGALFLLPFCTNAGNCPWPCKDWSLPGYIAMRPLFSALVRASDATNLQVYQHYGDEAAKVHCLPKFFNWNELTITWSRVARIEKRGGSSAQERSLQIH